MKKRTVALLLAAVLLLGGVIGGTLAWLMDQTGAVTNTFTIGDVDIDLTETGTDNTGAKEYDIVPGDTASKDPKVTVIAGSVKSYLFISVTEVNNSITLDGQTVDPIISWTIADGWTEYTPVADADKKAGATYYYRVVEKADVDQPFDILEGNEIAVSADVTKAMVAAIGENLPQLIFDSAAIQYANVVDAEGAASVDEAWDQLKASLGV